MNDKKMSNNLPTVLSVSQMAKVLQISRARFYQCLEAGYFLKPQYTGETHRPYYTAEMAQTNLDAKRTNVGINGKICLFYSPRNSQISPAPKSNGSKAAKGKTNGNAHADLIAGLAALGLTGITSSQIQAALSHCYPDGYQNIAEGEVLRNLYLYIKCQNSTDNVNR
jgi:predicted DNA-binding transcriptional regulator AlpA